MKRIKTMIMKRLRELHEVHLLVRHLKRKSNDLLVAIPFHLIKLGNKKAFLLL